MKPNVYVYAQDDALRIVAQALVDTREPELLAPSEIADLTDAARSREQIAWLRDRGWIYEVGRSGSPKVLRAYMRARMSGQDARRLTSAVGREPDFSKVR